MQQLPDQFNQESDAEEDTISYEPIKAGERDVESRWHRRQSLSVPLLIAVVGLTLLVSMAFWTATTDRPLAKLGGLFGVGSPAVEQFDPTRQALDQLTGLVEQHSQLIGQISGNLQSMGMSVAEIKQSLSVNDTRLERVERRVEDIAQGLEKLKTQRAVAKPVAAVKPKEPPKPQILVSLVSIRSQGGSVWVTLREGLDTSPLMTVGDDWRAVKVLAVDIDARSAQISANGALTVVKL